MFAPITGARSAAAPVVSTHMAYSGGARTAAGHSEDAARAMPRIIGIRFQRFGLVVAARFSLELREALDEVFPA